jgi:hypothetical protein
MDWSPPYTSSLPQPPYGEPDLLTRHGPTDAVEQDKNTVSVGTAKCNRTIGQDKGLKAPLSVSICPRYAWHAF